MRFGVYLSHFHTQLILNFILVPLHFQVKVNNIDETSIFKLDPEPTTDDQAVDENGLYFESIRNRLWIGTLRGGVNDWHGEQKDGPLLVSESQKKKKNFYFIFKTVFTCVGFWKYTSQKDLVYVSTQPREDFNNKKLVCSAHHGGKKFKRVKTSVTLKIECKYIGVNCKCISFWCFIQYNICSTRGNF